ncbi:MAG: hypothetical protein II921_09425 [Treponema sp.]|nr:hypothetical protein [Treponema sp.]
MKTRFLYAAALVLVIFAFVGASCSALFDEPSSGGAVKAPKPEPESSGNAEWTFIVYMAADNNLESAAISDLNEMEEARSFLSAGNTILVLLDRASAFDATNGDWSDTRLFRVASDNSVSPSVLTSEPSAPLARGLFQSSGICAAQAWILGTNCFRGEQEPPSLLPAEARPGKARTRRMCRSISPAHQNVFLCRSLGLALGLTATFHARS